MTETKLLADGYYWPCTETVDSGIMTLQFPYQPSILNTVKTSMEQRKWVPDKKAWSFPITQRNMFVLDWLKRGDDVYDRYFQPLIDVKTPFPAREHQLRMASFMLTRHYCLIAGEMGTGKTLAAFIAMIASGATSFWYVAPKTGIRAATLEMKKWKINLPIRFMTYEELFQVATKKWQPGEPAPEFLLLDESSFCKNPKSQRSGAARFVANAVRKDHGDKGYVALLCGTPAPKSPVDWWHQAEIAWPGFLSEKDQYTMEERLAVMEELTAPHGGKFKKVRCWRKGQADLCNTCGKASLEHGLAHPFTPITNEVSKLHRRLGGLVLVVLKKDCLDLPEKQYRVIKVSPDARTLNIARSVKALNPRAVTALERLRELSDGFLYKTVREPGPDKCKQCKGTKKFVIENGSETVCKHCDGTGKEPIEFQQTTYTKSPKEQVFRDLLEEHEEVGRFVTYAAYTASIDKLVEWAAEEGWHVARADSRGWLLFGPDRQQINLGNKTIEEVFQDPESEYSKVVFIANQATASVAITLTRSPSIFYYSNSFRSNDRVQSEDRIHRLGMDTNRGATIIDCVHLPSDELVRKNLMEKRDLELITLGEIPDAFETIA